MLLRRLPDSEERTLLVSLIRRGDELVRFPMEVFRQSHDEEDFIDTLLRLVRRNMKKGTKQANQTVEKPPLVSETSRRTTESSPKRKSFEFRGFLDIYSEKFSNEEFGILANLHEAHDDELQAIVYQCQNIRNQEVFSQFYVKISEIVTRRSC